MSRHGPTSRPIVTLTTDFGTRDFYAAAMKAAVIRVCPQARLIDITHEVPRHDILCGSITLERAVDGFLPATVHVAVIDPGVGTDRRILVVEINQQFVVCPDNGLITWALRRLGPVKTYALTWRPPKTSSTFHGRDIMGPAAAMIAGGRPVAELAVPIDDPVLLDVSPATSPVDPIRVIHVDQFGNATTNLSHDVLRSFEARTIRVGRRSVGRLRRTYWDVAPAGH